MASIKIFFSFHTVYFRNMYILSIYEMIFYGLNYSQFDNNWKKMIGVPFLNRLPFDKIMLSLQRDDA